jgi:hypothetical protein
VDVAPTILGCLQSSTVHWLPLTHHLVPRFVP